MLTAPVRRFDVIAPRASLLVVETSPAAFSFHAGQAVWLGRSGQPARKPYSIASAPADLAGGRLEFLIGLEDDGGPGPHLAGVGPGAWVDIDGPLGGFDLPDADPHSPVLLVAGGTGIAPLRSMWRSLVTGSSSAPIAVVYSARSVDHLVFVSELAELKAEGRLSFDVTITGEALEWRGLRGRLSEAILRVHVASPTLVRCAVCGPSAFVTHVVALLRGLGVASSQIATEGW
jgi:NAD(P)H-flavin reductase